jgi:hypothetical protein
VPHSLVSQADQLPRRVLVAVNTYEKDLYFLEVEVLRLGSTSPCILSGEVLLTSDKYF